MPSFSAGLPLPIAGQLALAAALAAGGVFLLLPKPRVRSLAGGIAACAAGLAVFAAALYQAFGKPSADLIGTVLFAAFAGGTLVFGTITVTQRNPARGAIAFAFVILSTCGLFLLLAAPFLMAATVVIYAGAIIVTFLFVLMLSNVAGPSDENDRSREPLLGSLAGFGFAGLVLFTLYQSSLSVRPVEAAEAGATPAGQAKLPAPVLTADETTALRDVVRKLRDGEDALYGDLSRGKQERVTFYTDIERALEAVVGVEAGRTGDAVREGSMRVRLAGVRADPQAAGALALAATVRRQTQTVMRAVEAGLDAPTPNVTAIKADVRRLREDVLLLSGVGELPARNVGNLGYLLYADHLLAVELAGTLLLVATIGAVAISQRKGAAS